jgi:hypothetical protein
VLFEDEPALLVLDVDLTFLLHLTHFDAVSLRDQSSKRYKRKKNEKFMKNSREVRIGL